MRRGRAPHFAMLLSLDSTGQTLGGAVSVVCDHRSHQCLILYEEDYTQALASIYRVQAGISVITLYLSNSTFAHAFRPFHHFLDIILLDGNASTGAAFSSQPQHLGRRR